MNTLEQLEAHRQNIAKRTAFSVLCYAGFIAASVAAAFQSRPLEDPVTLSAIGFIVGAFLLLPRDYVTALLAKIATTDEELGEIDRLRQQQQFGLGIRVAYAIGAIITLVVIPSLLS